MGRKFTVEASLPNNSESEGALEFGLREEDLNRQWIPPVHEEQQVKDAEGNPVLDEEGNPKTQTVTVSYGRSQTDDEAVRDYLMRELYLNIEGQGLENITATIRYSIEGTIEFDARDWGVEDDLEEVEEEDVDSDFVASLVEDSITEAIFEDVRYNYGDLDWEVSTFDTHTE